MTDLLGPGSTHARPGADDSDDAARRERIANLQQRRTAGVPAAPGTRPTGPVLQSAATAATTAPRVPVATGSKIAAAGFGMTMTLGLVAAMGIAGRASASDTQPPAPAALPQVVVVIHPADSPAAPAAPGAVATVGAAAPPATAAPAPPVVLSAQPTVRPAPASAAPSGRTHGSR